jgi:hypothetical protein
VSAPAGGSLAVVDEALAGLEMITIERIAFTDDGAADIFGTLEVEKTTVHENIPSAADPHPSSQTNREVFLCTPGARGLHTHGPGRAEPTRRNLYPRRAQYLVST